MQPSAATPVIHPKVPPRAPRSSAKGRRVSTDGTEADDSAGNSDVPTDLSPPFLDLNAQRESSAERQHPFRGSSIRGQNGMANSAALPTARVLSLLHTPPPQPLGHCCSQDCLYAMHSVASRNPQEGNFVSSMLMSGHPTPAFMSPKTALAAAATAPAAAPEDDSTVNSSFPFGSNLTEESLQSMAFSRPPVVRCNTALPSKHRRRSPGEVVDGYPEGGGTTTLDSEEGSTRRVGRRSAADDGYLLYRPPSSFTRNHSGDGSVARPTTTTDDDDKDSYSIRRCFEHDESALAASLPLPSSSLMHPPHRCSQARRRTAAYLGTPVAQRLECTAAFQNINTTPHRQVASVASQLLTPPECSHQKGDRRQQPNLLPHRHQDISEARTLIRRNCGLLTLGVQLRQLERWCHSLTNAGVHIADLSYSRKPTSVQPTSFASASGSRSSFDRWLVKRMETDDNVGRVMLTLPIPWMLYRVCERVRRLILSRSRSLIAAMVLVASVLHRISLRYQGGA